MSRKIWVTIVCLALIPLFGIGAHVAWVRSKIKDFEQRDQVALLAACREAIAARDKYPNSRDKWGTLHSGDVLLPPPFPDSLPIAIRELHPRHIIITADYAMIDVSPPLSRVALIGFAPGAEQFGTRRHIDGLWFWNGNKGEAGKAKVL